MRRSIRPKRARASRVRGGHDAKALKRVVDEEKLTWRSFADPGGDIAAKWNLTATPTLYVIDPKKIIRHKWVGAPGAKAIDAALGKMIKKAEEVGKKAPR